MPTWIDLTEHNAALNVYQTQEGKQLILRSLSPQHPIPEGVVELGFSLQNGIYSRSSLRFTLQEVQRYFPLATSRDFAMSEIFYVPAAAVSAPPFPEEHPHPTQNKAPWQMTAAEWHEARAALHVTANVSASSEATRITRRAELTYGVQQWRHDRAIAGDIEAQEALESPITHLDVVKKALSEGRPVPFDVVAEYAELLEAADEQPVVPAAAGDVAVGSDTAGTEPTDQVASDAVVKSARKKPGTERIIRPHEASRFGRHGFVSEYFVAFEDGRFPTTVEALDRSQAIQFAKKERGRLENRIEEHASPEIVSSHYEDGRTIEKTPYEYGRDAYLAGKMAVPALDKEFSETFLSRPDVLQSLTDWAKGWHEANAANSSQVQESEQETSIPPSELPAEQQAAEEQAKWEKYEPFISGLVTKPAAAKIGFTKTWVEKDNGWFQIRNGSDPVWTNGHIFDLGEPHYTGFAKYHSSKYRGIALEKRPDVSRYLLVDASIQIQPVFIQRDVWQDHDAVIFERPGGGIAGVDKLYYDYVTSKYPGAEYFIANDWSGQAGGAADIVVAKVAGKVVAGLMPIRAIGDLTVSQIREKIDLYRPAPTAAVQAADDIPVITREFSSKQRAGRRPAATGTIKVMQVDDRWYNAIDTAHNQGNHCGRLEPLTTHGEGFDTQFAALFDAGNRIVMEQRGVADGHDSMKTDKQRAAALEMAEWALQEILPSHQVTPITSGPYQGWAQAAVVDGEHRGVLGIGSDEKDAIEDLRQRLAYRLQGGPQRWRHIGTNQEGLAIEEDALGVRSILSNGVRMTESVSITPYGPRFSIERRDLDYLTTEELHALRKEEHAPENHDKEEAPTVVATEPHGQLADDPTSDAGLRTGDQLAGRQIDAFVDGTPVSFQRRRYGHDFGLSKKQAFTWGYAYLDGDWKSLGDPWPIPRPGNAELATAINYVRTVPDAFDSDATLTELNQDIERENAGIENPALYLQAIPTDVFRLLKLDGQSFEMRFKDSEEPFSIIIECQSPGVYLPKQRAGGSGPLLSLRNAAIWAMKELNKAKAYREQSLEESNRELPRFITDFESFKNLFGEPRDNLLTIKDVQAQYPDVPDDPQASKFLRSDDRLKIPADLVLEWIDERTVNVSIADPDHQYQVQIRGMDGRMDEHGRSRWLATYALKNAIAVIDTELTWERTKAARADGGSTLDDLAKRYAEFMHSHDPARHNGAVGKMHRSFALALADKDYDYLIGWIARPKGQNDLSKKFFTQATGIKLPKTARDITTTLYAWAGYSAEDALQIEAEKAQRHEQALQQRQAQDELESATRILENTKVNHNGTLKTGKAFIDDIIEAGFDTLETKKVGAVNRYRLVNSAEGRLYEIKGSMVDYARHSLKLREDAKLLLELQDDEPTPALKR